MSKKIKNTIFNKTNRILLIIVLVLTCTYIISFTKSCSSTDKREIIKSALVNKKYKDKIKTFELQSEGQLITLSKDDNNWYVIPQDNPNISLPADNEKIQRFINDLIEVSEMYKLSDKLDKDNAFGFNEPSAFSIRYYLEDSDSFNDIIFGNQDFALSSRYMMSGKNSTVYEISNKFDKYLSTSSQSWTEPFIISQQFLGQIKAKDIQRVIVEGKRNKEDNQYTTNLREGTDFNSKLLELRHGGFPPVYYFNLDLFDNYLLTAKIELGNKNNINMTIALSPNSNEQEYFVRMEYENNNENLNYVSYSKISGWTYSKITEIML